MGLLFGNLGGASALMPSSSANRSAEVRLCGHLADGKDCRWEVSREASSLTTTAL